MSNTSLQSGNLRSVFVRVAEGKLQPDNFGKTLAAAVTTGLFTKEHIADVLGTDVDSIRKIGDTLKSREIARVSRDLIAR